LNAAATVVAAFTVTTQAAVPLQAPLQPVNTEPALAVAVSVTRVPTTTVSLQSVPHATPPGELVTVPDPEPLLVTESVAVAPGAPDPLTPREAESLPTVKVTLPAKLPETVGRNRTVTVCEPPGLSENDPPDTMLNGALTLADPETVPPLVFCTVKVRSSAVLSAVDPKAIELAGVTVKSVLATPLAVGEQALSFPLPSMAVTRAKYVVPAVRAVMLAETVSPDAGVVVDDDTV
jgi:hypothetical protein